jgi:hypothetical protein
VTTDIITKGLPDRIDNVYDHEVILIQQHCQLQLKNYIKYLVSTFCTEFTLIEEQESNSTYAGEWKGSCGIKQDALCTVLFLHQLVKCKNKWTEMRLGLNQTEGTGTE